MTVFSQITISGLIRSETGKDVYRVMLNPFDIFNNTTAVIIEMNDYDDYKGIYTLTEKETVTGDLQPYSGSLLERDYGFNTECQKRFFCPRDADISVGTYLKINNQYYIAVYKAEWETGLVIMLKEAELDG